MTNNLQVANLCKFVWVSKLTLFFVLKIFVILDVIFKASIMLMMIKLINMIVGGKNFSISSNLFCLFFTVNSYRIFWNIILYLFVCVSYFWKTTKKIKDLKNFWKLQVVDVDTFLIRKFQTFTLTNNNSGYF